MAQPQPPLRVCPTRRDGRAVLVAHRVTTAQCQDRQRGKYHKCFACAYDNAWVAKHGLPVEGPPIEGPAAPVSPPIEELHPAAREEAAGETETAEPQEPREPAEAGPVAKESPEPTKVAS